MEWYIPITILPGISLLVLSTSSLVLSLNEELKQLNTKRDLYFEIIELKLKQLKRLSLAMIGLYVTVFLLVLAGILDNVFNKSEDIALSILLLGIFVLGLSIILLINYSIKSLSIRQKHLKIN